MRPSASLTVKTALEPSAATTWLLVTMWPAVSQITPDPSPEPERDVTSIETVLGITAAAVAAQSGADVEPCTTLVTVVTADEVPCEVTR